MGDLIRITVIGDGNTGKTCMLFAYKDKVYSEFPSTVFDTYSMNIDVDSKQYKMVLVDTAGQEEYDKIRVLAYKDCPVFLLCYAVDSRKSFDNVKNRWAKELRYHSPNCKIILVANKTDLRTEIADCITTEEGQALRKKIKANDFAECSAKRLDNVDAVFEKALIAFIRPQRIRRKSPCVLL